MKYYLFHTSPMWLLVFYTMPNAVMCYRLQQLKNKCGCHKNNYSESTSKDGHILLQTCISDLLKGDNFCVQCFCKILTIYAAHAMETLIKNNFLSFLQHILFYQCYLTMKEILKLNQYFQILACSTKQTII